jgi:hypothetical protein
MPDPNSNPQIDYVAQLWDLHNRNVRSSVASGSLRRMVVDAVEADGTVIVREVGTNDVHDEPYQALASPSPYAAGDYVIVGEVMGRGPESSSTRIVIGKAGVNSPSTISDAKSQATSDTPTTTNIPPAAFVNAITLPLVLPAGTWTVSAQGSVLMSHSVNQASFRLEIDGQFSNTHTLSMVTEERFSAAFSRSGVTGGRTINVRVQFQSFTAGTTSARNPMISAVAVRQ